MSSPTEQKPVIDIPTKSSMEILSELFNSFDAEPPLIIKKEDNVSIKKSKKKDKKKRKHKDKKHKKKDKKRKRSDSLSSDETNLAKILIKQEKALSEQKIETIETILENVKKEPKERDQTGKVDENKIKEKDISDIPSIKIGKEKKETIKTSRPDLEEGELSNVENSTKESKHKRSKRSRDEPKRKRHKEKVDQELKPKEGDDLRNQIKSHRRSPDSRGRSREDDGFYKSRAKDYESRSRDSYRHSEHDYKKKREIENPFYKNTDSWSKNRSYDRGREKHSDLSKDSFYIDKKKLLEIARKNTIHRMKSSNLPGGLNLGPHAQEKMLAAIQAGGKSIEELTDFCKSLSKKESLEDMSSNSEGQDSDSDIDKLFHHPFQIKDRPTSITMNIKNSVPLPIKSTQERSGELRLQFPVSSGQLHRKTENEWTPVSKKKREETIDPPKISSDLPSDIKVTNEETSVVAVPGPQVFPITSAVDINGADISSIVSQRLTAMRKLQENPNDVQALTEMYKSNKEMQTWAESKQQPGQFTGTTGAQVLSQAELSSGYQAWAKKNQLITAPPVSCGMGMHLLQKMGWKPGEGLGKEKTGALEPLLLEVKHDKKGLVASEEQKKKRKPAQWTNTTLENKHPVSLLGEFASKRKLGAPQYNICFECGPDHKKNFLFKVILNGIEYKPNIASANKKEAKAQAATMCLQQLGLLP